MLTFASFLLWLHTKAVVEHQPYIKDGYLLRIVSPVTVQLKMISEEFFWGYDWLEWAVQLCDIGEVNDCDDQHFPNVPMQLLCQGWVWWFTHAAVLYLGFSLLPGASFGLLHPNLELHLFVAILFHSKNYCLYYFSPSCCSISWHLLRQNWSWVQLSATLIPTYSTLMHTGSRERKEAIMFKTMWTRSGNLCVLNTVDIIPSRGQCDE